MNPTQIGLVRTLVDRLIVLFREIGRDRCLIHSGRLKESHNLTLVVEEYIATIQLACFQHEKQICAAACICTE
jgi:hypothetical protein